MISKKKTTVIHIEEGEQPLVHVRLKNGVHVIDTMLVFDTGGFNTLIREDLLMALGNPDQVGMVGVNFGGTKRDGLRCYAVGIEVRSKGELIYEDQDHVVVGAKDLRGMGDVQGVVGRDVISQINVMLKGISK